MKIALQLALPKLTPCLPPPNTHTCTFAQASRQAPANTGNVVRDLAKHTRQTLARAYQPGNSRAPAHLCQIMQQFLQGRGLAAIGEAVSSAAVVKQE